MQLLEDTLELCGRAVTILRPPDPEALLDEEAFAHEEFLPYWAELWPSGLVLARAICGRDVARTRVLELGCGLALPSLAAAIRGARVLATDWSPDAVRLARENAARNGVALEVSLADWAAPEALVAQAPWDLVLAADVLYERRNVEALLDLLPQLVDTTGEVIVAEPGRPPARAFAAAAPERWDLRTELHAGLPRVDIHTLRLR